MSLRRKSCNAYFQGRRKCDFAFPTCQRCRKTIEELSICYRTGLSAYGETYSDGGVSRSDLSQRNFVGNCLLDSDHSNIYLDFASQAWPLIAPNLVGELGDVSPLHGKVESWQWVIEQLQDCPGQFAKTGENMFIHPSMYRIQSPPAIKAAFGICTASHMVTPATRTIFTSALESEVNALLSDIEIEDVLEGLTRLQAMLLYQIMRLLAGDQMQQSSAEQQKGVMSAWALRLLQRPQANSLQPGEYGDSVLAESVRRTVMVTYLLHALGSICKHGVCTELPTLALLPVSVGTGVWEQNNILDASSSGGDLGTMKYGEWTDMWVAFPPRCTMDAFQRMLIVIRKGKAQVEELEAEMI